MRFHSPQQFYTSIDSFNKEQMDNNNNNNSVNFNHTSYNNDIVQQQQQQHGSPSNTYRPRTFITQEQSWLLQQQQQQQPNVWNRASPVSSYRSFNRKPSNSHQFLPLHSNYTHHDGYNSNNNNSAPSSPILSAHRLMNNDAAKPSPGLGIRRLAEQFLNSLTDESPTLMPRRIGLKHTSLSSSISATSTDTSSSVSSSTESIKSNDTSPSLPPSPSHITLTPPCATCLPDKVCSSASCSTWFHAINDDIASFSTLSKSLFDKDQTIRNELCSRTSAAIKAIWPTCVVDVVGSVASNVALPKSDIDFVIYFPNNTSTLNPPRALSYHNDNDVNNEHNENTTPLTNIPFYCSHASKSDTADSPTQIQVPVEIVNDKDPLTIVAQHHTQDILTSSTLSSSEKQKNDVGDACTYFGHAGSLIKLIGGRKKSKLLFRSTKIQVFKDINLIRLRDGVSGISMDLWMPVDTTIVQRSQKHTELINKYCNENPSFYSLAVVIKTFMQQNLLNSGYSGLGSYGVLLMIIRYIQHIKFDEKAPKSLSGLLLGFFTFFCEYDYMNKYISVAKNTDLLKKNADAIIAANKKKIHKSLLTTNKTGGGKEYDGDDDDNEGQTNNNSSKDDDNSDEHTDIEGSAAYDKFTLMIEDPLDNDNLIICHHKALRNMLTAFTRACQILHPNAAPPTLAQKIPILPHPSETNTPHASPSLTSISNIVRLKNGVDTDENRVTPTSSVFNILIDTASACEGPSMKMCPSSICNNITLCPIQNKLCFTCGYAFVKSNTQNTRMINTNNVVSPQHMNGAQKREYSKKKNNVRGNGVNRNYAPQHQFQSNMHMMNAVAPVSYMHQTSYTPQQQQYYPTHAYPPQSSTYEQYYPDASTLQQQTYQNPQQLKSMMNMNELSAASTVPPARATHMVFVYNYQPAPGQTMPQHGGGQYHQYNSGFGGNSVGRRGGEQNYQYPPQY